MSGGGEGGRSAGFSLVEMLVVLAILGLAAGLGVTSIQGLMPSRRLSAAAEALAGEIALLRTEAQRTGRVTGLAYDGEGHRFLSSRPGARILPMAGLTVSVAVGAGDGEQPGNLRFLPDGGSTGARITLAGPRGARILTVGRATGVVRQAEVGP